MAHSHGPIAMSLASFDDVIPSTPVRRAHSLSSSKNRNTSTGNLIKTEYVFFIYLLFKTFCCFVSLTSFLFSWSYENNKHLLVIQNICT